MEDVSLQRPIIDDYGGEIHSPISPITSASANVVVNKNIVVNFEVPHISAMYEGKLLRERMGELLFKVEMLSKEKQGQKEILG